MIQAHLLHYGWFFKNDSTHSTLCKVFVRPYLMLIKLLRNTVS